MKNDAFWTKIIYIISVVISLAVAFLILGPRPEGLEGGCNRIRNISKKVIQ